MSALFQYFYHLQIRIMILKKVFCFVILYSCLLDFTVADLSSNKIPFTELNNSDSINIEQLSPSLFNLKTDNVVLSAVLKEFSKKTGTIIHYNNDYEDNISTVNCAGDFVAVMSCLLGENYSVIVRHQESVQSSLVMPEIAEIWLVQKTKFEQSTDHKKIINESKNELIESFLLMAKDPYQRKEAIAQLAVLASNNDFLVKNELMQAMSDKDPEIRAQAIFGLGKYHQNDSLAYLRLALSDESLDVRLMALEQCTDYPVLLEQALNDDEAAVRDTASMKLRVLSKQHNKN